MVSFPFVDRKSWVTLELPKILERVAGYAAFTAGAERVRALEPTADLAEARRRQAETSEARRLLVESSDVSFGGVHDIREAVDQAEHGAVLIPHDLLHIRDTLVAAQRLRRRLTRLADRYPLLAALAERLEDSPVVVIEISRALNDQGEVVDAASPALAQIRRDLRIAQHRLQEWLQSLITNPNNLPFLQEALITQRSGRYVIPLKTEFKGRIPGIVHDQSASGATLFIEPLATVELNNRVRELELAEENEIRRILTALSRFVAEEGEAICRTLDALAELDAIFARAQYAEAIHATAPDLVDFRPAPAPHPGSTLRLIRARHPLLDPQRVVPVDVVLDEHTYALVITGPNTGGKTVSLKTVGLLALMAQAGLHLPAAEAQLSVFEDVFADIGDEQSIEQNLSTFSSHMTNIVRILRQSGRRSLVILDELGAGTDPTEGSALARAILAALLRRGVTTLVATHYPELKVFAHVTPGVQNASLEFDLETLAPTYHLMIGLPGRSNAFAIAERLGLDPAIIAEARALVPVGDLEAEALLADIHETRQEMRQEQAALSAARARVEALQAELADRLAHIDAERRAILEQARAEARAEIEEFRAELRALRRRLQAARQPLTEVREVEAALQELAESVSASSAPDDTPVTRTWQVGDRVWLPQVRALGTITALDGEEAEVQLGRLRVRARTAELEPPKTDGGRRAEDGEQPPFVVRRPSPVTRPPSPGLELHLRGQTVDEALAALDRYLNAAYLAGLPWVRIVHGKGTGTLRRAVRRELARHPLVLSYEPARDEEGGEGVTVVKLAVQ